MMRQGSLTLRVSDQLPAYGVVATGLALAALAIWLSRVSFIAFGVLAFLLLAVIVYASIRWPRAVLVLVAMSAILDRYVVAGLLPASLGVATHVTSEALLGIVGLVLAWKAWQERRFFPALRHPATAFLALFIVLAAISTLVNRAPIVQAAAGMIFTLKAVALFYLARMVGFSLRQAMAAIFAVIAVMIIASGLAILQALLDPNFLGLNSLVGRFGEPYRLASIFGDPNVFGALLSATLPFAISAAARSPTARDRWVAASIVLLLAVALWLSFSRGGWLGMLVGFTIAGLILDRRSWLVGIAAVVVAFAIVSVMPRNLAVAKSSHKAQNPITSTQQRVETVGRGQDLRTLFVINAIPILADHQLVGVGPGMYGGAAADLFGSRVYADYRTNLLLNAQQRTVDNFWLHLFVESGVLGGLAFIGMLLTIGVPLLRSASHAMRWRRVVLFGISAAALSLIVNSGTTMLLEASSVAFVFWFVLGLGSGLGSGSESELVAANDLP
jgi:O-antigen ligase